MNERNISADRLYSRAGFHDLGLRRAGGKGPQKILQLDLRNTPALVVPPIDGLQQRLGDIISRSTLLMQVFTEARKLTAAPYYVGAGCLVQTVWNELTGREPDYGISDIDIVYYDSGDLSYDAEHAMIARGQEIFAGIPIPIDLKNQARVHLWYHDKFGMDLEPYTSLEAAIDTWPTTATCLGAHLNADNSWEFYAPFGLEDLFAAIVRPNKVLINESIYNAKAHKWKSKWPELEIIPWME